MAEASSKERGQEIPAQAFEKRRAAHGKSQMGKGQTAMSFAAKSHPEYESNVQRCGVELLSECREKIAAMPDASKAPLSCPLCGMAIGVRVGRHSTRYFLNHPKTDYCDRSDDIHSYSAKSREDAVAWFLEEQTP